MTVVVALRLIDERKIGYTDPIARWLPDFPKGDSITIEHLLRHRSGIRHDIVPDTLATKPMTAAAMVEKAKALPLDFPPGSRSSYSSGGFTVLARILELASGKDYQALLEEYVFRPCGMTHSLHTDGSVVLPGRAACYVPGRSGIENAPYEDLSGLVGAGSVWSTARDVNRFAQAVAAGGLGEGTRQSFVRGGKLALNGLTSGFRAFADWDSASGLGVVFLANVVTGAANFLRDGVPRLAAGETLAPAKPPTVSTQAVSAESLRKYEGAFQLANGVRLNLHVRDGALFANDWPLFASGDGSFFSPRDYGVIRPIEGADGRIERLDWKQGEQVYPAPRIAGTTGP
jgi:CubicO group peptidase (beta-lactamase class C family)